MILCDKSLIELIFNRPDPLLSPCDPALVNPASVDIRVGSSVLHEIGHNQWAKMDMEPTSEDSPAVFGPGKLLLVSTLERIIVPTNMCLELRLKSSTARRGWDHALAFWFDPGWNGIGTMELKNNSQHQLLKLWKGQRIAQVIVHQLDGEAVHPYDGKYQMASTVEEAKE